MILFLQLKIATMQNNKLPTPDDHRRMIMFFIVTALIMLLSYVFITKPNMERARQQAAQQQAAAPEVAAAEQQKNAELLNVEKALAKSGKRIALDTPKIMGSLSVTGVRFDDVLLKDYFTALDKKENVRLLAPSGTKDSNFVEVGLIPADSKVTVPNKDTQWKIVSGGTLTPTEPVVLEWDNGQGLVFQRTVSVDRRYVFTIVQTVVNKSDNAITLYPYALSAEAHHMPVKGEKVSFEEQPSAVQHIGPLAYMNEELHEISYKDMIEEKTVDYKDAKGWLGITRKYWMVGFFPKADETFDARLSHQTGSLGQDIFQADYRAQPLVIEPGQSSKAEIRFFAGAKKLAVLNDYMDELNVPRLDLAVDFGRLYFLTKPLYHFLSYLGNYFQKEFGLTVSFGLALLVLTVLVRAATFPLQNKSYRSMNAMKDLAPKMHELKEKYGNDKPKFQQEMMALYKREKVNPASGCLPILIQIPIFFALYKVLYITLDMRQAPFWGWIHDLSAPDPTNVFNLFGLLPFAPPVFLAIGAWPLLYGLTMWVQQSLNPKPEDPTQQQIFAFMPWVFTFVFAKFPAGLVIYYTWSNILGIVQQYSLRRLHSHTVPVKKHRKTKKHGTAKAGTDSASD